jgi:hypothetical protein
MKITLDVDVPAEEKMEKYLCGIEKRLAGFVGRRVDVACHYKGESRRFLFSGVLKPARLTHNPSRDTRIGKPLWCLAEKGGNYLLTVSSIDMINDVFLNPEYESVEITGLE